jgi:subtilisin-like proprotein convertase family protein
VFGAYNADSQSYDALVRDAQPAGSSFPTAGNQEMVIVFSAGNSGAGANSIGSPGTGKNVFCIGAAENVQPFGGNDGCGIADSGADNANDIIGFSSRGPCDDGRQKPDIVAPGTHVSGGVFQVAAPPASGQADVCYDGSGVCGGLTPAIFFPAGQQWWTASSGTSHSCPAVAGGCALVRQFFINQGFAPPSPAMTKSFLMNSARYMSGGAGTGDSLWSPNQGMGEMNLGEAFNRLAVTPTFLRDEVPADMFTATGQTRSWSGTIADSTKPLRITLAWTDTPGPTSGAAYVNNLNLTVTAGPNTYKGNVFAGASSVTGGVADAADNVESVLLPAGLSGPVTITVTAANIAGDGVPNTGGPLDQDFALVAYNTTGMIATATGACCLTSTTCAVLSAANCASSGGVYRGDNSACPTIVANGSPQNFASTNVPIPIPDLGTANSTLSVAPSFPIFKATVNLSLTHTWDSDLIISLIPPSGPAVVLASNVGGSGDNFTNTTFDDAAATSITAGAPPFTGTFRPSPGMLSSLQATNSSGTWTLRIQDTAAQDVGTLLSWNLSLTPGTLPTCSTPCYANCDGSTSVPLLTVADFACFLNRYAAGDSYANCDGSTAIPVLTVADFACFLNSYAAGCP